jgi:hypothetical protein
MGKYIPPKLVEITWLDPHSPAATAVYNVTELDDVHKPIVVKTVGRLLRDDHVGITLACEDVGENNYRGLTFILRVLIENVKPLSSNRKPRKAKIKPTIQETEHGKSITGRTEGQLSRQTNVSPTTISIPSDNG